MSWNAFLIVAAIVVFGLCVNVTIRSRKRSLDQRFKRLEDRVAELERRKR